MARYKTDEDPNLSFERIIALEQQIRLLTEAHAELKLRTERDRALALLEFGYYTQETLPDYLRRLL